MDVAEESEPMAGITTAEEIFLTSSTRDVHPVAALLDPTGELVWQAGPGPVTREAAALFAGRQAESWNP
jgi:branched-chain amino acid aminotransferase